MEASAITVVKGDKKAFHHGGRLGDAIFALYTVKELGGGLMLLSDFQYQNWDEKTARSLLPLIKYQEYISEALYVPYSVVHDAIVHTLPSAIDYDLHEAELDYNPEMFPEWKGGDWPGNCNIAKRYAVHFGVNWDPEAAWLTAPKERRRIDVAFHAPLYRLTKDRSYFTEIIKKLTKGGLRVFVLGNDKDLKDWEGSAPGAQLEATATMMDAATLINSARVFLGAVSSCNAIAEGLKKERFLQVAPGCDNVYPYGRTGHEINDWEPAKVVEEIMKTASLERE